MIMTFKLNRYLNRDQCWKDKKAKLMNGITPVAKEKPKKHFKPWSLTVCTNTIRKPVQANEIKDKQTQT